MYFSLAQFSSVVFSRWVVPDSCDPKDCSMPGFLSITNSRSLLKLMSIELMMPSNHLFLCHPLLLLPSIFPSIGVFSSESALRIRWPKYWSFIFSINPSSGYSELISFRMDWFDLFTVQGTLKSLLQHHNLKASAVVDVFYILTEVVVSRLYVFIKTHRSVPWKRVNVIIYKLYFSKLP